jgi:signal transduction histidine kinase
LRLFRTTAFRLSAIYLAVFTVFAAFLIGYIGTNTSQLLNLRTADAVDVELRGLAEQYRLGGVVRLAAVIDRRGRQPGASLYLVTDYAGRQIAGNVESVPSEVLNFPNSSPQTVSYLRVDEGGVRRRHPALVRVFELEEGFRILVGRDISDREELSRVFQRALLLTFAMMLGLGLISWLFVSRRVLNRIDSMAATSRQIVAGDLSGRLEVTSAGDEFDRLAESLNTMLDRIEKLMVGLKEVTDNIAHDLKTPLTRMRNRLEVAMGEAGHAQSEAERRESLQGMIEDADQLIRTFNALLMIARVEAGSSDADFERVDATQVASDVYELYEPLAEDAGVTIELLAAPTAWTSGNRELIGQALANLVDNALKYANDGTRQAKVVIAVEHRDNAVIFSVADNGPGISEADRDRVTRRFVRLETSRSKPGSGLGLSLVSAVAQLHGGELVLEDNNPGLRACLVLPASGGASLA